MAKLFKTSEDVASLVKEKFHQTHLDEMGVGLRIMSTTKANDVVKIGKVSQTTQFLTQQENEAVQICIYETAFSMLDTEAQNLLLELAFSNISYDLEKDKLNIITNPYASLFQLRRKYDLKVLVDTLETSYLVIEQIAEQEAEKKAAERERKKQNA